MFKKYYSQHLPIMPKKIRPSGRSPMRIFCFLIKISILRPLLHQKLLYWASYEIPDTPFGHQYGPGISQDITARIYSVDP